MDEEIKGDGVECVKCSAVFAEVLTTFRVAVETMKEIAAEGKGQDFELKNNTLYNRYLGCAIAMDTLLKEHFKNNLPEHKTPEVLAETKVAAAGEQGDVTKH